jgi:hypothetical protein
MLQERQGTPPGAVFLLGDSVSTLFDWLMRVAAVGLLPQTAVLARTPRALQESLLFPYVAGSAFCLRIGGSGGGFGSLDRLYRRPPLSTEQVLHPEKAAGPGLDLPTELRLPDLGPRLPGYRRVFSSNLGEMYLRLLFEPTLGRARAEAAAAGWDGDRFDLYRRETGAPVLLWLSTWDSEAEAREAERALLVALAARPGWALASAAGQTREGPGQGVESVERAGRDLTLLIGLPAESVGEVRRQLLAETRRRERRRLPP